MSARKSQPALGNTTFRPAERSDALCLSVLAMQVFLDTYATEGIRPSLAREVLSAYSETEFIGAISSNDNFFVIAEQSGHLVGFAQVVIGASHELAPSGLQCELLRLYVQSRFSGIGIGSALLSESEHISFHRGTSIMWLTPWVHNHRALRFYVRHGYVDYGQAFFEIENESHENRVYAKRLLSN